MAMGMGYEQFWDGHCELAAAYRKAFNVRRRFDDEKLWLQGIYFAKAISAAVDSKKHPYPKEPLLTDKLGAGKKSREQQEEEQQQQVVNLFHAFAVNLNQQYVQQTEKANNKPVRGEVNQDGS